MRVVHVLQDLSVHTGGPPVIVAEASEAMTRLGVPATIVATNSKYTPSTRIHAQVSPDDLPPAAHNVDVRLCATDPPRRIAYSRELIRVVDECVAEADVVHMHMLYFVPQWAAYRSAKRHGAALVISPHGGLDPYLRRHGRLRKEITGRLWLDKAFEYSTALHLGGEEEIPMVSDIAPHAPREVVPNGVRWKAYQGLPSGSQFRENHLDGFDGELVLFMGRLTEKKKVDLLIRAFALLVDEGSGARLVLAGPDHEGMGESLRALVADLGVTGRVVFPGTLTGDDKLSALNAADVWVLSSASESYSMAVIEALAAGLPCVLTPQIFLAPELAAEDAAVIVELNPRSVADGIDGLLRDPARRHRVGESARAFARHHDWSETAKQWVAMYDRAIELNEKRSART